MTSQVKVIMMLFLYSRTRHSVMCWYIYIQYLKALGHKIKKQCCHFLKLCPLQSMLNLDPHNSGPIYHGSFFYTRLDLHLKGIFNAKYNCISILISWTFYFKNSLECSLCKTVDPNPQTLGSLYLVQAWICESKR